MKLKHSSFRQTKYIAKRKSDGRYFTDNSKVNRWSINILDSHFYNSKATALRAQELVAEHLRWTTRKEVETTLVDIISVVITVLVEEG